MAIQRYVLMATATVPAGTPATVVAGDPRDRRRGWLRQRQHDRRPALAYDLHLKGTPIILDPASALYSAIGAGNLRAWSDSEAAGHAGLAN